jgi:putative hydrolase of the HAD superfamily
MVADAFFTRPDEPLAGYVARLRARGVRTAALTNNIAGETALIARPELARLFDVVISSADVGLAKPDPAIFRHAEARLDASGGEIVFVDDVAIHLDAARALGWRTVQFGSTDQAVAEIETALGQR